MASYNNQDAWRPVSVPLPAVLNQSTATQTVGLFYPTHEQVTRSPQDVEAVRQVREQITTGTGTGPAQEKARLTDISPGKGYWKRQIAHIAAHLEAFSQKDAEFRAGVGKPKMGKVSGSDWRDILRSGPRFTKTKINFMLDLNMAGHSCHWLLSPL